MKVVVAGGTGLIGTALIHSLLADGHQVTVLSRSGGGRGPAPVVIWDAAEPGPWAEALAGADAVVNLSGASMGEGRWTPARRRTLLESRTRSTSALVAAIGWLPAGRRPGTFICASGIDYYGDRGEEVVDENSPPGDSFLARVAVAWEAAAHPAEAHGCRVALVRTAFVLARGAPALRLLTLPIRLGVGGRLGSGRQYFPWIHIADLVAVYRLALETPDLTGPINAVAPDCRTSAETGRLIAKLLGRPYLFPTPAFALRMVLGGKAELVLHGRRAVPAVLQRRGFRFRFGDLEAALRDVL